MSAGTELLTVEAVPLQELAGKLTHTRPFANVPAQALEGFSDVEIVRAKEGAVLAEPGKVTLYYWVVLEGECRADRPEPDGTHSTVGTAQTGEAFGETPFLTGKTTSMFLVTAVRDSVLLRFTADQFWSLLACCPEARKVVLGDMATRLQIYQAEALHREKLVSLGTLAAGLMHELHNPGSAAKRAASQLRENLLKLQDLSLRSASKPKTPEQMECMHNLLQHAMKGCHCSAMSSIEQADAEERLAEWLQDAGVENAFTIAPSLVEIGFEQE